MAKLILCQGAPASGKTTWALAQVVANPEWIRVNRDDIRRMMCSKWSKSFEVIVREVRDGVIKAVIGDGRTVICDDTNLEQHQVAHLSQLAKDLNAEFEIKIFHEPLDILIERNNNRPEQERVPLNVVKRMFYKMETINRFQEYLPHDPSLPDAIIVDIDGTIALNKGGRGYFDWARVGEDSPNTPLVDLIYMLISNDRYQPVSLIFVSGRDEVCRDETDEWLYIEAFSDVEYELFMRPEGDNRKDSVIKREIFDNHIRGKYNVICVFDDRDQTVKEWRDIGLLTLQVAPGNF